MKESNAHKTDMQKLADTGWKQMHEMLVARGLSGEAGSGSREKSKKFIFLLLAACIALLFFIALPFISTNPDMPAVAKRNVAAPATKILAKPGLPGDASSAGAAHQNTPINLEKRLVRQQINAQYDAIVRESSIQNYQTKKAVLLQKFKFENQFGRAVPACDHYIDTAVHIQRTPFAPKKAIRQKPGKLHFYAGAGVNLSTSKSFPDIFNGDNLNLHPEITLQLPLGNRLTLFAGVTAFSTIHGREVTAKEKELVNSFNSNVYYNINTTSIIKASYFELPVTVNYKIKQNWSVGCGMELAKLYKVNIREEKESFNYNNTLASASVSQMTVSPMAATAALDRKLKVKNFEPRFVAETHYQANRLLFSAGYIYGLGKTISLKDAYNSTHQFRNEYFKVSVQYQLK